MTLIPYQAYVLDISLPHLTARISALFRRQEAFKQPVSDEHITQTGSLTIDSQRMTVTWQNKSIDLTITEFWLVHALAKHPGHVKNRNQLMTDSKIYVDDSTITSHIKRIRKKFIKADDNFDCIETVYGMGYRWLSNISSTNSHG